MHCIKNVCTKRVFGKHLYQRLTKTGKMIIPLIPIGERFDPIDMILVASVLGTGAIRIDPETEFRGHGLSDRQDQTFSNMVYDVL